MNGRIFLLAFGCFLIASNPSFSTPPKDSVAVAEKTETVAKPVENAPAKPVDEKPLAKQRSNEKPAPANEPKGKAAAPLALAAAATTPEVPAPANLRRSLPEVEKSSGAFTFAVPIEVPAYHGVEPNLALSYASSSRARGRADAYVGVGWALSGFSTIDRVVVGGGVPTFNDNLDVFQMDGETLLSCTAAAGATVPYADTYPTAYKATSVSASCSAGGNLTSQKENYLKIVKTTVSLAGVGSGSVENFEVYSKDGTRRLYKSVGELWRASIGATTNFPITDGRYRSLFERKFLLVEVRGPQKNAASVYTNIASYSYSFDDPNSNGSYGYTERPKDITYGGYVVEFKYSQALAAPVSTFAIGGGFATEFFGAQRYLLRSVSTLDGTTQIKSYGLTQTPSVLAGSPMLTKVQEYGAPFQVSTTDGSVAMAAGGLALPPHDFAYSDDMPEFNDTPQAGTTFHGQPVFADLEPDGRTDVVFPAYTLGGTPDSFAATYKYDPISASLQGNNFRVFNISDYDRYLLTIFSAEGSVNGVPRSLSIDETVHMGGVNHNTYYFLNDPSPTSLSTINESDDNSPSVIGEFDGDLYPEALRENIGYLINVGSGNSLGYTQHFTTNSHGFTRAALLGDLNGNGLTDSIAGTSSFNFTFFGPLADRLGQRPADGFLRPNLLPIIATPTSNLAATTANDSVLLSDLNGDGADDALLLTYGSSTVLRAQYSNGYGFSSIPKLLNSSSPGTAKGAYHNKTQIADVNGDGLNDLIVSPGASSAYAAIATAKIYINKGNTFALLTNPAVVGIENIPGFIGAADVNGDGLPDLLRMSQDGVAPDVGAIRYSSGLPANMMTNITTPLGATVAVSYAPSSDGVGADPVVMDDGVPGVRQVVAEVTTYDGRSYPQTTKYRYSGAKYDETYRKSLGFTSVRVILPKLGNEATSPVLETIYDTSSYARAGNVLSETLTHGTTSYSRKLNTYGVSGTGPHRAFLTTQRSATLSGSELIETRKDYLAYSLYGEIEIATDWANTNPTTGADLTPDDNTRVTIAYNLNTSAYIVGLPRWKVTSKNVDPYDPTSRPDWFVSEGYLFDGLASVYDMPTEGNLTNIHRWTGNTNPQEMPAYRTIWNGNYDDWGNKVQESDALGRVNLYEFDAIKHLFPTKTTNALGQVANVSTWNTACQSPASSVDINGLTTNFYYDQLCREYVRDLPGPPDLKTSYNAFGSPMGQYIEQSMLSPGLTSSGSVQLKYTRSYFDGLGRTYKSAATGKTSAEADMVVSVVDYDARGNQFRQSTPLTWAEGNLSAPPADKVILTDFDPLNRPVKSTAPDGSTQNTTYLTEVFTSTGTVAVPHAGVSTQNEHCNDSITANTLCGETRALFDSAGRKVRERILDWTQTSEATRMAAGTVTDFRYDLQGRLVNVTDPIGATWTYTYDVDGNRIQATDPGLGTWTMTYDAVGNLWSQTDAKQQVINFRYDSLNRPTLKIVQTTISSIARTRTSYVYDQVRASYYNMGKLSSEKVEERDAAGLWTTTHTVESDYHLSGQKQTERNIVDGLTYTTSVTFTPSGHVENQALPYLPGSTQSQNVGQFIYDAGGRVTSMQGFIPAITYDIWGHTTRMDYANGAYDLMTYSPTRGWVDDISGFLTTGVPNFRNAYTRTATGRIAAQRTRVTSGAVTSHYRGDFDYTYDFAGRLIASVNPEPTMQQFNVSESFSYDKAGRMLSKGNAAATAAYLYGGVGGNGLAVPAHAPRQVGTTTLSYDQNGNMTNGLSGRIMTYDAENRPLSVTLAGKTTCYVYGAGGARLKKIENLAAGTDCKAISPTAPVTLYFGAVEVRNFRLAGLEQILTYPQPSVKLLNGVLPANASYLHRDAQGSVRQITSAAGVSDQRRFYLPYGAVSLSTVALTNPAPDTKGWIGERLDADAGLQYLNARYYDPQLGMFLQPDWWEVMQPGVGTNRYSYSFGDPVNGIDPSGHTYCAADGICFADGGSSIPGFDFDPVGKDAYKVMLLAGGLASAPAIVSGAGYLASYEGTMAATALASEGLASVSGGLSITAGLTAAGSMAKNAANGGLGELIAGSWLTKKGFVIEGSQVQLGTSAGKRVIDYLIQDKIGKRFSVEVKSGNAVLTKLQAIKDSLINSSGGRILSSNLPALKGSVVKMDTMDIRVDVGRGCVTSCSMRSGAQTPAGGITWSKVKSWLGL